MKKGLVNPLTGDSVVFTKRYLEDDLDEKPRGVLVAKRQDESALEHHGSRRMRKLPVVNVRVSGLPVQSAQFSAGHTWERPGTSHANKFTHVHTKVKAPRTGKLFQLKHGRRSVSGSMVGKSAGFAQSGSSGRRIVSTF